MRLRIPTRRHPPDEEEHAGQQVEAQRPVVRLQVREVDYLLLPLTPVPLSFLQCDLKSTAARSV